MRSQPLMCRYLRIYVLLSWLTVEAPCKREQNLIIGTIDYRNWCEATPLIVISCQGPSSLSCFHSGRRSADSQCSHNQTPPTNTERKQAVKGGPIGRGQEGPCSVIRLSRPSIVSSSVWATELGKGAFIKILLFNGLFSAREQEAAEPSVLLSDLRWMSASMLWSLIMESTVVFIFSEKRKRLPLPLFFKAVSA